MVSSATTQMDLENVMLREIGQSEKDKYHHYHSYVGFQKQKKQKNVTNEKNRPLSTEQAGGCQRGGGWWSG